MFSRKMLQYAVPRQAQDRPIAHYKTTGDLVCSTISSIQSLKHSFPDDFDVLLASQNISPTSAPPVSITTKPIQEVSSKLEPWHAKPLKPSAAKVRPS